MFKDEIVIDGHGHLMGRLASYVAKELLCGQKITVVRCEALNISGSLYRNHLKYKEFRRKRTNTNPRRGPFHYTAPSMIFWRTVRGMLPRKTERGQAALNKLKTFDGVPFEYTTRKKMCVSDATKVLRLKPHRKFCVLGDLSKQVGWKRGEIIDKLNGKRAELAKAKHTKVISKCSTMKAAKTAAATKSALGKSAAALIEKLTGRSPVCC